MLRKLNFNYFIDETSFEYLLRAVELLAEYAWRLLPYYKVDQSSGIWRYQNGKTKLAVNLDDFDMSAQPAAPTFATKNQHHDLAHYLDLAEETLRSNSRQGDIYHLKLPTAVQQLCWFVLPQEVSTNHKLRTNIINRD